MLAKRIIAVLTFDKGLLTRTKNFIQDYHYTKKFINNSLFDGIVLIDVSRNKKQRSKFYDVVKNFSKNCFVPITVGGMIDNIEEIKVFQNLGVDKILINSIAVRNEKLLKRIINIFGSQFVVIGLDVKKKKNSYNFFYNNGKKKIEISARNWINKVKKFKPGEILLQSIDQDGSLKGFDLKIIKKIRSQFKCPLLVCGGGGNWEHFVEAFKKGNVDAVCTNNIYHLTHKSILSSKLFCIKKNVEIRLE